MMTLKERVEKAEDVAEEVIVDVIKHRNKHIFITESGRAVLLEEDDLPNAVFASVKDAERNLTSEARSRQRAHTTLRKMGLE